MSSQIQKTAQQQTQTTATATNTNPNLDITPLIMPISYAISGAIALAAIAAFLRQLFNLGRE
jgi:hypothetical protein